MKKQFQYPLFFSLALLVTLFAIAWQSSEACTRILWNNNKLAVLVSRTMDWPESTEPIIMVFPRGIQRDGGHIGPHEVVKDNPEKWTSKYGSVVTSVYGLGSADGFNERGLGGHMLFLNAADFGPRDASKPGLHAGLWLQYILDNCGDVKEALAALENVQIVMAEARGTKATVHLAIEDTSCDSAIIEYVAGKPLIHHGREFRVMTNDPPYDQQLELMKKYDFSKPSSDTPLPGNVSPTDRFVRASYYLNMLPEPKDEREGIASVLAVARSVSVPFGAPYKKFGVYNTEYRTVMDLTNQIYFFELTTTPNVIWADLKKFDLAAGAPVRELNPDNIELSGNVAADFSKDAKAPF